MKTKLENILTQALCLLVMVLFGAHALFVVNGSAHLQTAKACAATTSATEDWTALLTPDGWEAGAETFVARYGLCIAQAVADQVLARAEQLATPVGATPPLIAHTRAWRAANP